MLPSPLHHQPIGLPSDISPGDIPCSPPLGLPLLPGDVPVPGIGVMFGGNCLPHRVFVNLSTLLSGSQKVRQLTYHTF